jgi:hypothetical protein
MISATNAGMAKSKIVRIRRFDLFGVGAATVLRPLHLPLMDLR